MVISYLSSDTKKLNSKPDMFRKLTLFEREPDGVVERCDKLVTQGAVNYLQFVQERHTRPIRKSSTTIEPNSLSGKSGAVHSSDATWLVSASICSALTGLSTVS